MKDVIDLTETYHSGNWYMTISNEMPMTDDGKTYCEFDLIKDQNSIWGCPVNQFGTIEEVLDVLKGWRKIDDKPEFQNVKTLNSEIIKMEDEFINILERKV